MPMNMNPASFGYSIESLMAEGTKPPNQPSTELDRLAFRSRNSVYQVWEALKSEPIVGMSYRALSRYATHVAIQRFVFLPEVLELQEAYKQYVELRKSHTFSVNLRKEYTDRIETAAKGLKPTVIKSFVTLWFWDEADKDSFNGVVSSIELNQGILYLLCAGALSEIPALGEQMVLELQAEYRAVMRALAWTLGAVKEAIKGLEKEL